MHKCTSLLLFGAVALFLGGCAGSLDHPERFLGDAGAGGGGNDAAGGGTCPDVVKTQFIPVCATSSCHSAVSKSGNLDLETADIAGRLRGKMALGGGVMIDPANPDKSVLYTKITAVPPYGSRMPLAAPPLDDKTTMCIKQWVEEAAKASAPVDGGTKD